MNDVDIEVIVALADCSLNVPKVAQKVYMHPDTVRYHIRKIKRDTGKNPLDFYDLLDLLGMVDN